MRLKKFTTVIATFAALTFMSAQVMAQDAGDYRSAATGDWSDLAIWEMHDGIGWDDAGAVPDGSENIAITGDHIVTIDDHITISGTVVVEGEGELAVAEIDASLTIADGGTYQHDRNDGEMPSATWEVGSTVLFTGIEGNAPANRNQDFHHVIWDNPNQSSNLHMGWEDTVIGGDVIVKNSGGSRFQMTDAGGATPKVITIEGDLIVEGGQVAITGSGGAQTYEVTIKGDVHAHPGTNLAPSRGSGGHGTFLLEGNFTIDDATLQDSHNDDMGTFKFVGTTTQIIDVNNASYTGTINFVIDENVTVEIADQSNFNVGGNLINQGGEIITTGTITFENGSVYEHAFNGGDMPVATWEAGSTALFTGIEGSAPGNRNQDFHHVIWDNPNQSSNLHMGWNETVIGGDVIVKNSGGSRFQFTDASGTGPKTITIEGDLIVEGGQATITGSGGAQTYEATVKGNVHVHPGTNLAPSRGSGGHGTFILEGDFTVDNATLQDSHNDNLGTFRFAGSEVQTISFEDVSYNGTINYEVASGAIVNVGSTVFENTGGFSVSSGGEIQTSHADGIEGNIESGGVVSLSTGGHYTFNGTDAQVTSTLMPATVGNLTIDNAAGVTLSQATTVNGQLILKTGQLDNTIPVSLGPIGELVEDGGTLLEDLPEGIQFEDGDFRAVVSGDWSASATWEVYDGGNFVAATSAPTGSEQIVLMDNAEVIVDVDVTISGSVIVTENGVLVDGAGDLSFAADAEYEHNRNDGTMPTATWEAGSTVLFTGVTGNAPANRNQDYHHFVWNNPEQSSNLHMGFNNTVIGGNLTVFSSGGNRFQLTDAGGELKTITVEGDVIVEGGTFAVTGSGGAANYELNVHGDVHVSPGANFSASRGSGGVVTINLYGDFNVDQGTIQDSNNDDAGKIVFAGDELQNINFNNVSFTGTLTYEIAADAVVNLGSSEIGGGNHIVAAAGAELQTSHADGLAGNFTTSGDLTLSEEANYAFNGSSPQITSTALPTTVNNLTIDNETTVTLSQETTINGNLYLLAGIFNNSINFTLGENGEIVEDGGLLLVAEVDYEDGDIRSIMSGAWSNPAVWEVFDAGADAWTVLTGAPDVDGNITIWADHEIEIDGDVTITGSVTVVHGGKLSVDEEEAALTFADGSMYTHGRNAGEVPTATWEAGSTFRITGTIDEAPENRGQNYHHIVLNTPLQSSNLDLDLGDGAEIGGNISIINTGSGSRWYLTGGDADDEKEITIMGNITMQAGQFSVHGTGNANTHFVVNHHGNVNVTDGNFSVSRGSQGTNDANSPDGSTYWYFHGGDFIMANGQTQNSNPDNASWIFSGNGDVQTLDISPLVTVQGSGLQMEILDGAAVNLGESNIRQGGDFTLHAGAELQTTALLGFESNLTTSGTISLSQEASYSFVGSGDEQETSFSMPQVVQNLTIDNPDGVYLSRSTTVNGKLILKAGVLDNTEGLILGDNAEIVEEGGSLLIPFEDSSDPTSADKENLPTVFALNQNYPNPFNPTTQIRYDVPESAHVRITVYDVTGRQVAVLVNGIENPGRHSVTWNANQFASGLYFYRMTSNEFTAIRQLMLIK